ncbi:hypothetical protein DXG01_000495 [Tephrocybe rancida]|nr:hypothetical protein DXG01_000495 [Tephrocybe rancida]
MVTSSNATSSNATSSSHTFSPHWDAPFHSSMTLWRGVTSPTSAAGAPFRAKAGGGIRVVVRRYSDVLYRVKAAVLFYWCVLLRFSVAAAVLISLALPHSGDTHSYASDHHTIKAFDSTDNLVATFHVWDAEGQDSVYSYNQSSMPCDWPRAPTSEINEWQARNIVVKHAIRPHCVDFIRVEKELSSTSTTTGVGASSVPLQVPASKPAGASSATGINAEATVGVAPPGQIAANAEAASTENKGKARQQSSPLKESTTRKEPPTIEILPDREGEPIGLGLPTTRKGPILMSVNDPSSGSIPKELPPHKTAFNVVSAESIVSAASRAGIFQRAEAFPVRTRRTSRSENTELAAASEPPVFEIEEPEDELPFPKSDPWTYPIGVSMPELAPEDNWSKKSHLLEYSKDAYFKRHYVEEAPNANKVLAPSRLQKGSNGLLYFLDVDWNSRLCVPKEQVNYILRWIHESPFESAHAGPRRFLARLKELFFWPAMTKDAHKYAKSCDDYLPHSSTTYSPNFLLMGYKPQTSTSVIAANGDPVDRPFLASQKGEDFVEELNKHRQSARDAVALAQERQARAYNKGRRPIVEFEEGDWALVNPHTLELVDVKGTGRKLVQQNIGPFEVLEKVNPMLTLLDPAQMSPDTRKFDTPRRVSLADYVDQPVVDDTLTFRLPAFITHSGRLVATYELWSPNTMRYAFYPGVPPPSFVYAPNSDDTKRLFDGHLGRYDYTVSPQTLQKNHVWRALIYRPRIGQCKGLIEFGYLYEHWVSEDAPPFTDHEGYLSPAYLNLLEARVKEIERDVDQRRLFMENNYTYLWSSRPKKHLLEELKKLRRARLYEHAIDWGAELQRGIKEMDAWVRLADTLGANSWKARVDKMRQHSIELADDDLLGSWVNGNLEDNMLLLLSLGAPCYIIHELDGDGSPGTERYEAQQQSKTMGWMDETDLDSPDPAKLNEFDRIALRNGSKREVHYSRIPRELACGSRRDKLASSALRQGWLGPQVGRHLKPPPPIPLIRHELIAKEEVQVDPTANKHYLAKPLELVRVYKDRIEWIKPPPVLSVVSAKGEWSKWEQQVDGDFIRKGKGWSHEEEDAVVYFDRENFQELVLEMEEKPPKGAVSDLAAFGMPAPVACYWKGQDRMTRERNSRWMYLHRHPPRKEWTDMVVPIPKEDELPLDYHLAAEALLEEVQPMDVDVEDSISLGSDGEGDIVMSADTAVPEPPLASDDAAETSLKASQDAAREEPQGKARASAPGVLSCHLCRGALTTPRTHEEILKAVRTVSERDLAVFISRVIITGDGQIWVSTTTSDGAQSFANSGVLEGLWDYVSSKEIDEAEKTAVYRWDSPREPASPSPRRAIAPTIPALSMQQRRALLTLEPATLRDLSLVVVLAPLNVRAPRVQDLQGWTIAAATEAQIDPDGIKSLLATVETGAATSFTLRIPQNGGIMVDPHALLDLPPRIHPANREQEITSPPKPTTPAAAPPSEGKDSDSIVVDEEEQKIATIAAHRAGAPLPLPLEDPVLHEVPEDQIPRSLEERIRLSPVADDVDEERRPTFFERMSETTPGLVEEPPNVLNRLGVQFEERVAEQGIAPAKKKRHRGGKKEKAKLERKRLHREADAAETSFSV